MQQHVLVAGGAGFLGSHLCAALLGRGDRVTCVDNFYTGRHENLAALRGHPHLTVRQHDITEPLELQVDAIYNLACAASPVHYQADPVGTLLTCVQGSHRLLELARRCRAPILQASTSEVYGDPLEHPQPESYRGNVSPVGPRACYDEGKRAAEALFFDYRRQHGVRIRVARIFNTYGPHMHPDDGRVVSNFIVAALAGAPLPIYGDGEQSRSFCYVDDLIAGLLALMQAADDAVPGPVNLGNPREFTVASLADAVVRLCQSASPRQRHPLPVDDPTRRQPDIALARRALGWEPRVELEEGLRRTIAYFAALRRLA